MLKLVCKHCGDAIKGNVEKFCSQGCEDYFIASMEKRICDAVENDPSHIAKMSKDE